MEVSDWIISPHYHINLSISNSKLLSKFYCLFWHSFHCHVNHEMTYCAVLTLPIVREEQEYLVRGFIIR